MARGMMNALVGAAVASCVLVGSVEAQTPSARGGGDPFAGVWKLNVARSVYTPGPRPPADMALLYQFEPLQDGSTRFTLTGTNPAGDLTFLITVFKVDGQRRPVHNVGTLETLLVSGKQSNVMRTYRRIDATTVEFTTYTDGVTTGPVIRELLPDGDTYVQRPANREGNVLVFERVH